MPYTVHRTNGTTLVEIADQTINTTSCSLALVGRGAVNYGQAFAENFVKLAENFANATAPSNPLTGQQWYDVSTSTMKYFDGSVWRTLGAGGVGNTGTASGATTIGGTTVGTNRVGGFTGAIINYGLLSTTVGVMMSEGRIVAIVSMEDIAVGNLPAALSVDGRDYALLSRFPNGIKAGITLATDAAGYTFAGLATSSRYADLAERYAADEPMEAGDVVEIGGEAEIRKTTEELSVNVFGVVSTAPGMMLNADAGSDATHPYVALTGRVPCKVVGRVRKGERLVSSSIPGVAMAADSGVGYQTIVGRALADKNDQAVGLVEIVIGGVK